MFYSLSWLRLTCKTFFSFVSFRYTWSNNSQCNNPYTYCEEANYIGTEWIRCSRNFFFLMSTLHSCVVWVTVSWLFTCWNIYPLGNGTFPSGFSAQESQSTHTNQSCWTEEQPQESPSTWDTGACVGSKVATLTSNLIYTTPVVIIQDPLCVLLMLKPIQIQELVHFHIVILLATSSLPKS